MARRPALITIPKQTLYALSGYGGAGVEELSE